MPEEKPERKECPLSFANADPELVSLCLEERCAWWDREAGVCAVYLLADELRCIRNLLEIAREKEREKEWEDEG
jgi:hypothetical protein